MSAYCCIELDLLLTLNHDARNHVFKINIVTPVFFSISVHCMIYSMNTSTTAYNLEFQSCKSVAMFRSFNTGLMIVSIVICLACT